MSIPYTDPNPPFEWLNLNPLQSYIQQGALRKKDYIRLVLIVIAYIVLRPYIDRLMRYYFNYKEPTTGEENQEGPKAKVDANSIREGTSKPAAGGEAGGGGSAASGAEATTSGRDGGGAADGKGAIKRGKAEKPSLLQKEKEKLVDWEDEPVKRPVVEGDGTDVMEWLGKWDSQT